MELQITNYEIGVVILLKDAQEADSIACFQRPPTEYTPRDEPWVSPTHVLELPRMMLTPIYPDTGRLCLSPVMMNMSVFRG